MCGIAGVVPGQYPSDAVSIERCIAAMNYRQRHRGPDHQGFWSDGFAFLGASRLAVLDTSPNGNQPMGAQHVHVVANGEIYNCRALRRELESAGHVFRGHCDTEVIVHGYLEWGRDILAKLRGMFALAIWDGKARRLILARDRAGKKPLFYARVDGDIIFASEVSALLTWPGIKREANLEAIHHFLSLQYVPSPESAFDGIAKLPPAHCLVVAPGEAPVVQRFATFPPMAERRQITMQEAQRQFTEIFDGAVRSRMASDVPLGVLLSGGIDSTAVVAFMSRHAGAKKIKTFSLGFADSQFDERPHARAVARHFNSDHHDIVLEPDLAPLLPKIAWRYGEPFADPSALPSFCVAEMASKHVKVLLTGDGGDEAFLGYTRYQNCRDLEWVRRLPNSMRRLAGAIANHLPADADGIRPLRILRRGLSRLDSNESRRYARDMAYFEMHHKNSGYGAVMQPYCGNDSFARLEPYFQAAPSMVAGAARSDLHSYLPDDLLVKLDIATMAHGVEGRCPFLDQSLLDWAITLPEEIRFPTCNPKAIVKAAIAPLVPDSVLQRPKQGFGIPLQRWLGAEGFALARDILMSTRARERGLFKPGFTEKLLSEHGDGRFFHHTRIWAMLMLELWFMTWIDPPAGKSPEPVTL